MKRFVLFVACATLIAASIGCRSCGNPFSSGFGPSAPSCCGASETVVPSDITYSSGSSVIIAPPTTSEVLPSPAAR